jgi:hypothetical protein
MGVLRSALLAKLSYKAVCDLKYTSILCHILTHDDEVMILLHTLLQAIRHRIDESFGRPLPRPLILTPDPSPKERESPERGETAGVNGAYTSLSSFFCIGSHLGLFICFIEGCSAPLRPCLLEA